MKKLILLTLLMIGSLACTLTDAALRSGQVGGQARLTQTLRRALPPLARQCRVTAEALNFRAGPGMNSEVLFVVKSADILTVIGASNAWLKVRFHNRAGWVHSNYCERK
jgi:uncharacterized protein YgiM (DUF1202 family)